ncbi:hypothetical protein PG994_006391 [Apiospora phragmitis]|uniref:Steroid 5-alpha reductase C-terminal domain-containing protein n=1 Tax=Apiospora phragmitis TaxID=2905665 RepID=A0ABR1VEZ0_9PEZI
MGLLQTFLHITNFRSPFLRTLAPSAAAAFAIQTAFAIPSVAAQSERFYDASGALTFLSVTLLSLYLPGLRAQSAGAATKLPSLLSPFLKSVGTGAGSLNWRQVALSGAVAFWSIRLGSFLFDRVMKEGKDSRFDEIKKSPLKFAVAWMGQATWVTLCLMPVIAINSIPTAVFASMPALKLTDAIGMALYIGGLTFEVIADRQKSQWMHEKRTKQHDEQFMTRGLWTKSQYPNYFGECTLWTGIATAAAGVLVTSPAQLGLPGGVGGRILALLLSYVSPAFVSFLLLKVTGVPLSEKKYDKRYGDREDYQNWKKNTPKFFPKL